MVGPVVCIVDGDPAVRGGLGYMCNTAGYDVLCFPSGAALLARLEATQEEAPPAAVICDAQLPDTDGETLILKIRARGWRMPVALMLSRTLHRRVSVSDVTLLYKPLPDSTPLLEFLSRSPI